MSFLRPFMLSSWSPNDWGRRDLQLVLLYSCLTIFGAPYVRDLYYVIRHSISNAIEKRRIRKSLPKGGTTREGTSEADENVVKDFEAEKEALRALQQRKQEAARSQKKGSSSSTSTLPPLPNYEVQLPPPRLVTGRPTTSSATVTASSSTASSNLSTATSSELRRRSNGSPGTVHSQQAVSSSSSSSSSIYNTSSTVSNRTTPVDPRINQERLLKAQQDFEYQQSIIQELEKKENETKLINKKQQILSKVPNEPEASDSSVITISFRMKATPCVSTMTSSEQVRIVKRRFDKEQHTLGHLLDFLDSLELRPITLDKDALIDCSLNFPRLKFNRTSSNNGEEPPIISLETSLAAAGIVSNSVVWVNVADD